MQTLLTDTHVRITCYQEELDRMESDPQLRVYGTPNAALAGLPISQAYIDRHPRRRYDRVIASVENFKLHTAYLPHDDMPELDFTILVDRCMPFVLPAQL